MSPTVRRLEVTKLEELAALVAENVEGIELVTSSLLTVGLIAFTSSPTILAWRASPKLRPGAR